jgi:UrcA family protein
MFAKTAKTATLAALAALSFAATAHAGGSSDPTVTSVSVSVADLNLSSPAGAQVVLRRIHNAAETICGDKPDIRLIQRSALYQSCVKTAVDRTVASLDSPVVTALNDGQPGAMTVAKRR